MKEFRIYGPPGTGKTWRLAKRDIPRAVERYGPDRVLVASFTRAAAKEIASRGIGVDERNVGTLHSLCFRALGSPELVEKHISKWNDEYPGLRLNLSGAGDLDSSCDDQAMGGGGSDGEKLYAEMQIARAKMIPEELWQVPVKAFKKKWDDFKGELGVVDFTDLIETALHEVPRPPGNPKVMFLDEAQDFCKLEFELLRRNWSVTMDWFVMVGDDDQTLYTFSGADPATFLTPIPDDHKTVLEQSYRVPRQIHARAMQTIQQIDKREPKEYMPRVDENGKPVEGEVISKPREGTILDAASAVEHTKKYLDQGKSVMFLTTCAYMLNDIRDVLKRKGIPYYNPYKGITKIHELVEEPV